jgi:hypothetical protein
VRLRRPPDRLIGGDDDPYLKRWHVGDNVDGDVVVERS